MLRSLHIHSLLLHATLFMILTWSPAAFGQGSYAIQDGFYLVLDEYESMPTDTEHSGLLVPYSHEYLEGNLDGQSAYLALDTSFFVPLQLSEAPDSIIQPDKRINLMLSLTSVSASSLEEFTGNNIMRQVAIVIGGKAMTKHKIREKITGGKIQITRCTDNACEYLFYQLQDNIKPSSPD